MKLLFSIIVSVLLVSTLVESKSLLKSLKTLNREKPSLRFKDNGKFKLVIFADLHYGEFPGTVGPENDRKSSEVMANILGWEKPDFVVFTGDQLTGDRMHPNASEYVDIVVKSCVDGNYKWASTYGNHDNGENLLREEMFIAESKYDLSYTQYGGEDLPGISNYYLLLYPPSNSGGDIDKPSMIFWFFDSQGNNFFNGEEIVDPKVVEWFKIENQRLLDLHGDLPGLAFFHIPTEEYAEVKQTVDSNPLCTGLNAEAVFDQDYNSGLMDALSDAGNIRTTFVGHDHANSWCCYYKNVEVCYNRHTGYGGYGWWERGARVIDLDFNHLDRQKNYLRMESQDIISQFPNPAA